MCKQNEHTVISISKDVINVVTMGLVKVRLVVANFKKHLSEKHFYKAK